MKSIQVRIIYQYGNPRVYPISHEAFLFCDVAGTQTLNQKAVEAIKKLGYTIEVIQDTATL